MIRSINGTTVKYDDASKQGEELNNTIEIGECLGIDFGGFRQQIDSSSSKDPSTKALRTKAQGKHTACNCNLISSVGNPTTDATTTISDGRTPNTHPSLSFFDRLHEHGNQSLSLLSHVIVFFICAPCLPLSSAPYP
ncbi:hypothetical protein R6Q59_002758 [Mikania micrantha]